MEPIKELTEVSLVPEENIQKLMQMTGKSREEVIDFVNVMLKCAAGLTDIMHRSKKQK